MNDAKLSHPQVPSVNIIVRVSPCGNRLRMHTVKSVAGFISRAEGISEEAGSLV